MPTLVDGLVGEAFPELMEHKEAVLTEAARAEAPQPAKVGR